MHKRGPEFLHRMFKEQYASKIPSPKYSKLYQVPDTTMLEDFIALIDESP